MLNHLMENCIYAENVIQNSKRGKVSCQAVCNKFPLSCLPEQLKSVGKLDMVLISKRLLFKKVTIMPKGQSPKV